DDRLAIAELSVRYGHAFDIGDGAAWAAVFAADGVFQRPDGSQVSGREALAAVPSGSLAAMPGMRHFPGPVVVDEAGGEVRGRSYTQAVRLGPSGTLDLIVAGEYADTYVREDGGWRFATRRFTAWAKPDA
ncbi:MAG: nuclear transport factor 2, partial [Solirubrobacterales bacterium]|nr:nuclear transport factor 2 [Solirubrobacterales bacterium]